MLKRLRDAARGAFGQALFRQELRGFGARLALTLPPRRLPSPVAPAAAAAAQAATQVPARSPPMLPANCLGDDVMRCRRSRPATVGRAASPRLAAVVLGIALGMAGAATATAAPAAAAPAAPARPHVLLVAVGDEEPVFDRFVADLARRFHAFDVAGLATASVSGRVGRRLDSPDDLYAAIRRLRGAQSGRGCLIYLTGHGTPAGLAMPLAAATTSARNRLYASLAPRELAAALRDGCGDAPTVVVASACYSGVYLGRGARLRGADRVVLTAAAADRTSFGCGNDQTYTYYDGCFLGALDELQARPAARPGRPTWRELAGRTAACVAGRERALLPRRRPSRPQSFFGRHIDALPLPGRR